MTIKSEFVHIYTDPVMILGQVIVLLKKV